MGGLPIKAWDELISAIIELGSIIGKEEEKLEYKYTWTTLKRSLNPLSPALICSLPEGNKYQIIINNKSTNSIFLYLGKDGDKELSIDNSAWEIKPHHGMVIEGEETTLWAIAKGFSEVAVTVHSDKPNLGEKVTIALNVRLRVGTGDLLGKDIPLQIFADLYSDWEDIIRSIIDSDQDITGHKLAEFRSHQPGATYEFTVNVAPEFTDFESGVANPINVHLIDTNQALSAMISAVAAMRGTQRDDLEVAAKRCIGFAKSGGWVASLPPTGGTFSITPGNSQSYLHFGAFTPGGSDACVITDFDKATNTFTLGGY